MEQLISGTVDTQKNSYRSIGQVSAGDDLELELEVKMNGQPIEFINPQAELLMKKADNNKVRQTKNILYQDGKFKIKVDEQGVTYPGIVTNQLVINDEGRVSTCLFYFNVGASLEREVLQSISKVEVLEQLDEYVVTAFSNLDEYETRLIELDGTMRTTNEEITVNESERKANESERKTNETLRIENEKERVKKENERSEAEIDRKENELDRIKNENARRIAENTRIARENARENAEINRNAIFEENEAIRNEAEKLREKAEAKRKENFSNLESLNEKLNEAEAERVKAEGNRESKETERQLAEIAREKAEANRENTYTNFNDAEVDRRNNENARIQAENLRVQEESIRAERFEAAQSTRETKFEESQNTRDELFKASETVRATEEIAREKAESTREGNEVIRVNSESLRESAENTRQQEEIKRSQAEELRVEAEKERELSYEEIKKDNSTFKDEMKTDFGNAKTDYFGEEHLNVVDRLNSDFDNVHQRINDSSYLEYSGSDITADNTYYGLTKELSIKGRTLQNICPSSFTVEFENDTLGTWKSKFLYLKGFGDVFRPETTIGIRPSTTYTIICNVVENTLTSKMALNNFDASSSIIKEYLYINPEETGILKFICNSISDFSVLNQTINPVVIRCQNSGVVGKVVINNIMLLEGDHTNTPINELPFGDGIYSVGENEVTEDGKYVSWNSCGKNLCDNKFMYNYAYNGTTGDITSYKNRAILIKKIPFKANQKLYFYIKQPKVDTSYVIRELYFFDTNGNFKGKTGEFFNNSVITMPNYNGTIGITVLCRENDTLTEVSFANEQVELLVCYSDTAIPYEPYQESIQELQLTEPLRSLPNGASDEILEDGTEIRRVGKIVLDETLDYQLSGWTLQELTYAINTINPINNCIPSSTLLSSVLVNYNLSNEDKEGILVSGTSRAIFRIPKNKLSNVDNTTIKEYLKNNPITLYFELVEPVITKHNKNINLKTFEGKTHITSDNYLLPTLSCKVPSNVQAVVSSLMEENEELNNTISVMSLKNEETELENIETNLDQDVRLTMLELGVI